MLFNAKTETAKISTSELLRLKIALYQKTVEQTLVDLCLLLALLQNGQSIHLVSTKSKQRRCASLFSVEAMVKHYQVYKDSWAAVVTNNHSGGSTMCCSSFLSNIGLH